VQLKSQPTNKSGNGVKSQQHMSVTKTIAKNTMFSFITDASDILVNLVVGIILARFLGPADYGLYSFLIWFLFFIALFANLGLGHMVIRFIAESMGRQIEGEVKQLASLAFWLRTLVTVLFIIILIGSIGYWANVFGYPENQELFIILALAILPQGLNALMVSIFSGFQKYEYGAYLILGTNPLRALGIIIVCAMGLGIREILLVSLGSWVLGIFIGLFLLRRLIPLNSILVRPRFNPEMKRALKYSMIMMGVMAVSYFMNQRAEILFLGIFHPGEAIGFYTIAFLVSGSTVGLILRVFSTVLIPAISEQIGRGDMERVRAIYLTSARYLMIVGIPLAAGGIVLAGPIISVVYGIEYEPAVLLLQILFIPFTFMAIANSATSVILAVNRPSFVLKVGAGLVILSVALELWLIPIYGATGAAIGSSVARIIAPIFYIRFASRECQTSWPIGDTIKISIAAAIMAGIIFGIGQFIERPSISIVTLVPLGVVIHFILIVIFRVVREQDISTLRQIQESLPGFLGRGYGALLGFVEKMAKKGWIPGKENKIE
jgi:O-antigen/teichoic acid export membrane protein